MVRAPLSAPYAPDPAAPGIFRYAALLPAVPAAARVSLAEGRTPLLGIPAAGHVAGVPQLLAKDESRNPTGTFKDRAMALAASVARAIIVRRWPARPPATRAPPPPPAAIWQGCHW